METSTEIMFYKQNETHGYMSNFSKHGFIDNSSNKFNCSEQYFMYIKCLTFDPINKKLLNKILNETTPGKIKQYGRQVQNFSIDFWNTRKYDVMLDALRYKFYQNKDLQKKLLDTRDKLLYEAAKNDRIWGIGFYANEALTVDRKNYGENLLGKALMEIRTEINKLNHES
jgi:ribA/ribD-fused uncharacterized protein